MSSFDNFWDKHIVPAFNGQDRPVLGITEPRESVVVKDKRMIGKDIEINGPILIEQNN